MTRKLAKIFSVFLLFTGTAYGAAFQFGGLRLDALSITSSGSATQLTKSDYQVRNVTGSATDVEKLPDATTLQAGYWYEFINSSSGALTVSNTSSTSVTSLTTGQSAKVYLTNNSTANGTWVVSSGSGAGGGGGCVAPVLTKTTDYAILAADFTCANKVLYVEMNCAAACTATLPAASNSGFTANVINIGTAQATIATAGSDTFGSTADTTWILPAGGSPQASNIFWANGGSRWNGF